MNKFFSQIMQYNDAIQLNILPQIEELPVENNQEPNQEVPPIGSLPLSQ